MVPLCEYLLKNRGVDFVKDIVKGFVSLKRPPVPNPPPKSKLQGLEKLVDYPSHAKRQLQFPPLIDPRGGVDVKEKVKREMLLGRNVEMAILLGFDNRKNISGVDQKISRTQQKLCSLLQFYVKINGRTRWFF